MKKYWESFIITLSGPIRDKLPGIKSLCSIIFSADYYKIHDNFKLMIIDKLAVVSATSNNPVIYKRCWNHHPLPFTSSFNIHWSWDTAHKRVHHHLITILIQKQIHNFRHCNTQSGKIKIGQWYVSQNKDRHCFIST